MGSTGAVAGTSGSGNGGNFGGAVFAGASGRGGGCAVSAYATCRRDSMVRKVSKRAPRRSRGDSGGGGSGAEVEAGIDGSARVGTAPEDGSEGDLEGLLVAGEGCTKASAADFESLAVTEGAEVAAEGFEGLAAVELCCRDAEAPAEAEGGGGTSWNRSIAFVISVRMADSVNGASCIPCCW